MNQGPIASKTLFLITPRTSTHTILVRELSSTSPSQENRPERGTFVDVRTQDLQVSFSNYNSHDECTTAFPRQLDQLKASPMFAFSSVSVSPGPEAFKILQQYEPNLHDLGNGPGNRGVHKPGTPVFGKRSLSSTLGVPRSRESFSTLTRL